MTSQDHACAEVLPTNTPALLENAVQRAAELLRTGKLVALPTETVYGLAANALDPKAVASIYTAKGRPTINPIIVHVSNLEMARQCTTSWPEEAENLANAFWPGPLTLVLPRSKIIPDIVTADGPTVGIRFPSHPIIKAVIQACGFPLAAPSANPSNQISPTTAEHVRASLGTKISLILDGGQSRVGIESTVLDLASNPPRLLRPGMVQAEAIEKVLGKSLAQSGIVTPGSTLRSPGMMKKHYSPKARLVILSWQNDEDLLTQLSKLTKIAPEKTHILAHTQIPAHHRFGHVTSLPKDVAGYARVLYSALHTCDDTGAELIIVEAPPAGKTWQGISDRLSRASAQ